MENNRILYVPENSTGDWNSIGVSYDKDIGSFFCKSNINGDGNGIYRRTYDGTTLKIYNSHSYPSFFGTILGVKSYRTEINLEAHKEDDKIIIEEKEIEA